MPNIKGWKMYDPMTEEEVMPGTIRPDHKGQEWTLHGVARPPEGASTGRILASCEDRRDGLFPAVFDLEIRPAMAEPEGVEELFASVSETLDVNKLNEIGLEMSVEAIRRVVMCSGEDHEHAHNHDPAQVIAMGIMNGLMQMAAPLLLMGFEAAIAYGRAYPEDRPGE